MRPSLPWFKNPSGAGTVILGVGRQSAIVSWPAKVMSISFGGMLSFCPTGFLNRKYQYTLAEYNKDRLKWKRTNSAA